MFETCRDYALYRVQTAIAAGITLDRMIADNGGGASPPRDGNPAIYWEWNSGCIFTDRDSGNRLKIKRGEIGVAFYYDDRSGKCSVFKLAELYEEITNPKPVQLALF